MNDMTIHLKAEPTMSSQEISNLTGKRHGDVLRDIRNMIEQLGDDANLRHVSEVKDARGYTVYINLPRRECEILVTGYDVKRRAAVIDRWMELESRTSHPVFHVPQTMSEALRLAADQADQIEQQQRQLEQAKPAVDYVERYVSADSGDKGFRQVAKLLKAKEPALRAFMRDHKIMYQLGGEWMPYQNHIDAGRFVVKTGVAENEHAYNTAKFTPKGVNWIAGLWAQYMLEAA